MSAKKKSKDPEKTLAEIREALVMADDARLVKGLSDEDRVMLEETAQGLRSAERAVLAKMQKEVAADMKDGSGKIAEVAKTIRERVSKMNKSVKSLDKFESFLKNAVRIFRLVTPW